MVAEANIGADDPDVAALQGRQPLSRSLEGAQFQIGPKARLNEIEVESS